MEQLNYYINIVNSNLIKLNYCKSILYVFSIKDKYFIKNKNK